ncbi:hypothetical protein [Streptomyces scabiei]|uniref:hypothetical protein n=1 Tax=Streptomyces scabiei TaxID=1930 RepID=UPI0029B46766|nr:hypothetical protein [Streptomyces scabiei]MDX2531602.1 hypothetical protein [Streptomyces scabiei]MDX2796660.1 hypothetical protein [Streptomyces scabiei]MDX2856167.1 hypothetical protein [Streptomyces scabiei]MDX3824552.1 hypothetical protein [Streptomyces scabiei]
MSTSFPFLLEWMDNAPQDHPLTDLIAEATKNSPADSFASAVVMAFENIIETLEKAQPERRAGVRRDFRSARTFDDDLMIVRAEMVAGAKLARAGIPFDFGRRNGATDPDLVLREMNLGIEVKARRLDGLRDLRDELQAALADIDLTVLVHLLPDSQPLTIKPDKRAEVVAETLQRVRSRDLGTQVTVIDQPWSARTRLLLKIGIYQADHLPNGSLVTVMNGFWGSEPGPHLADVEDQVRFVLQDEQKIRQAESMPTILLVDAARTGSAYIRSPKIWARRLEMLLPDTTPFVGAAVMIPTLDDPDVGISLGLRANLSDQDRAAVGELVQRLGLTTV